MKKKAATSVKSEPHHSGSQAACSTRTEPSDAFGLELAISQSEAEMIAKGEVPSAVQDVVLSLLIAMGQSAGERVAYLRLTRYGK